MNTERKRALLVGAGGVLGGALCEEFAATGHDVVCLRRKAGPAASATARTLACDLADPARVHAAVSREIGEHGPVDIVVHVAAHFTAASFEALALEDFDESWRVGVGSAIAAAKAVLPSMLERGRGCLLFTGATASLRGSSRFAALAAAKFALRGVSQSLAREYQPRGIHVAHVVIDGLLKGSASIQRFGGNDSVAIDPREAARTYRWLAEQPPSAWTHEIDLRPSHERF